MAEYNEQQLEEHAKELQREALNKWRKAHPDRVKEYNKRYWLKKAARDLEQQQA